VEDLGPAYRLSASSLTDPDAGGPIETTTTSATRFNRIDRSCPGARPPDLTAHATVPDAVWVQFSDDADRTVEVGVAPLPAAFAGSAMEALRKAIDACEPFGDENPAGTSKTTLEASPLTDVGDGGLDILSTDVVEGAGVRWETRDRTYLFVVGDVLVAVRSVSGMDPEAMEPVPVDLEVVPALADQVAAALGS
jgi:hypothetical protein